MLRELAVENLGLIAEAKVELRPGFCAWTGETGAGKTMLLEALGLLLGRRGSVDLIRSGEDQLRVTGCFELRSNALQRAVAEVLGQDPDEEVLILSRRYARSGKSQAYVNDHPVAVTTLRQVGRLLVDIHGQQESLSLLEPGHQLSLLDAYAELDVERGAFDDLTHRIRLLQKRIHELEEDRQRRQREIALLEFEKDELDQANLSANELGTLTKERERLAHAQKIQAFVQAAAARLHDEEGAVVDVLGRLLREGESWQAIDPKVAECQKRLEAIRLECTDLSDSYRDLGLSTESHPARLHEIEERLRLLRRLETKHGKSVDDLIGHRTTMDKELNRLKNTESDLESIRAELAEVYPKLVQVGQTLGKKRRKAAKKLIPAVQLELTALGMEEAKLTALFDPIKLAEDALASNIPLGGLEQMELMLAANRGEASLPLRRVASGGELSRAMLALKTVLAVHDVVPTLVFDEIDANVGGRLGDVLGEKLAALGRTHQVICVTHLPQVACYARHQWTIRKSTRGSRTVTSIEMLDEAARVEELSSMLRGKSRGELTKQEAAAMLSSARAGW